jgi:hypothetical protein
MKDPHKPFKFTESKGLYNPEMITIKIKFRNLKLYAEKIRRIFKNSSRSLDF